MQHIAILSKKRKLLDKIISGEKIIESRWYKSKISPWNKIKSGEVVYFKDSGDPVKVKAEVDKVIFFEDLDLAKAKEIVNEYGDQIALSKDRDDKFWEYFKNRKYCILIFLKNVQEIEPFNINKKGFGLMSAWICVDDVDRIKLPKNLCY